jgi:hypothetical protein
LTYELPQSLVNANAPLPPDELEYIGSTTERHLSAHPDYVADWLGNPQTNGVVDPYGAPTTTPTKLGIQSYFIPTATIRKVHYSHSAPDMTATGLATRNTPSGFTGTNSYLKTAYTVRITKGCYQLSEEWTYLPIGTWDTDIYDAS